MRPATVTRSSSSSGRTTAPRATRRADSTLNLPADFPKDFWVRIASDGTNVTGEYSINGSDWTDVGRPAPLPADAKIGLFAFSNEGVGDPIAGSSRSSSRARTAAADPAGPSRDDQFDGGSLDKTRWNAIVRDTPAEYAVGGGELTITTSLGDIYTGDTNPPPNNFILQAADARRRRLGDRDEAVGHAQRRLRAGRPAGLPGR